MSDDLTVQLDQLQIRQWVENGAVWRDAGDWARFRTVWHSDGVMMATWFQGPFEEFIRVSIAGWDKGVSILHFLGGSSIDVVRARAIAQTKMTISQRACSLIRRHWLPFQKAIVTWPTYRPASATRSS